MKLDQYVEVLENGARRLYGDGPPTTTDTGAQPYMAGDIIQNAYQTAGRPIQWRCLVGGNPGTWEAIYGECQQLITLTNAQTKATNTAPPAILAAQGAGSFIEVTSVILQNVFLTGAFANGGALALYYGTDSTGVLASATAAATFLTSPAANQTILLAGALASNLSSNVLNKGLVLANPTADFITGAGFVTVRIIYRVHLGLV